MPKEILPQVTYKDLKKQRLAVSANALIRYKGELYNLNQFRADHGGGTWRYDIADIQLYDAVSCTNHAIKPSVK